MRDARSARSAPTPTTNATTSDGGPRTVVANALCAWRSTAPAIAGSDARNDSSNARSAVTPSQRSDAIVTPLRESPGSTALPCATPTRTEPASGRHHLVAAPRPSRRDERDRRPEEPEADPVQIVGPHLDRPLEREPDDRRREGRDRDEDRVAPSGRVLPERRTRDAAEPLFERGPHPLSQHEDRGGERALRAGAP